MKNEILIVTDNLDELGIYRNTLESKGFTTSFRSNVNEAVSQVARNKVSLVIIDSDIPKVKRENLGIIRRLLSLRFKKIILIVNDISDLALDDCIEQYDINVIRKPFEPEDLLSDVELVLNS